MDYTTPQRIITVSILGTDSDAKITYTYSSPVTGLSFQNAPSCDMVCDRAIYSLFVLDYASTLNGWAFTRTSPYGTDQYQSPALMHSLGALNLSLMTYNPYTSDNTYRFFIHYFNTLTQKKMCRDPQEGNIPRPL